MITSIKGAFGALLSLSFLLASFSVAYADHAWSGYHWARTANPFTIKLGDNVSTAWDSYLVTTSQDWSANPATLFPLSGISKVLATVIVPGSASKNCKATNGMVQVCNNRYGSTGWLGVASIMISGTHITAGTVKLNDTYFNENFSNANLNTCMDYAKPANQQSASEQARLLTARQYVRTSRLDLYDQSGFAHNSIADGRFRRSKKMG